MRTPWLTLVSFALLIIAGLPRDAAAEDDREKVRGTWRVKKFEHNGEKREHVKQVILDGRQMTVRAVIPVKGGDQDREVIEDMVLQYELDPAKNPKGLTLSGSKEFYAAGIYELGKDKLSLCYAVGSRVRPTEFASKPGSKHVLIVLEFEKAP
jgi:uncharacterized protein (TIGR03067 family)